MKSRTTICIIKNDCVRKCLRVSHQATILAVFLCLNGFLSSVCNCCQLIQLILRPSNSRKRELGLKTRFISLLEQLCDLLQRTKMKTGIKTIPRAWHSPSTFVPTAGHFDSLSAPAPGNLPSMRKKRLIPGGEGGLGADGID